MDSKPTILPNGSKVWKNKEGQLHREDGPAYIADSGTKSWFINGVRHREDGPACEYSNGTMEWWVNGKRHREDGPAIDHISDEPYIDRYWYLDDEQLTEDEFISRLSTHDKEKYPMTRKQLEDIVARWGKEIELLGKAIDECDAKNKGVLTGRRFSLLEVVGSLKSYL